MSLTLTTWTLRSVGVYSGASELTVDITARVATITIPDINWNGSELITFTATDPSLLANSDAAAFTVTAINDAPIVADIPDQTVAEGVSFATINLDSYIADVDNLASEMSWTYSGNIDLTVSIVNRVAIISTPDINWNGSEVISPSRPVIRALLNDSDPALFTVTGGQRRVRWCQVFRIRPLPEGTRSLPLSIWTTMSADVDNPDFRDQLDLLSAMTELSVSIDVNRVATIYHVLDRRLERLVEIITFIGYGSRLVGSTADPATFTVTAVSMMAPVVSDIPDQTVAEGSTFATVNLDNYVSGRRQS